MNFLPWRQCGHFSLRRARHASVGRRRRRKGWDLPCLENVRGCCHRPWEKAQSTSGSNNRSTETATERQTAAAAHIWSVTYPQLLPRHCRTTAAPLPHHCRTTAAPLPHHCPTTAPSLPHYLHCSATAPPLPNRKSLILTKANKICLQIWSNINSLDFRLHMPPNLYQGRLTVGNMPLWLWTSSCAFLWRTAIQLQAHLRPSADVRWFVEERSWSWKGPCIRVQVIWPIAMFCSFRVSWLRYDSFIYLCNSTTGTVHVGSNYSEYRLSGVAVSLWINRDVSLWINTRTGAWRGVWESHRLEGGI